MRPTLRTLKIAAAVMIALAAVVALTGCSAKTSGVTNVSGMSATLQADVTWDQGEQMTYWFEARKLGSAVSNSERWPEQTIRARDVGPMTNSAAATIPMSIFGLHPETTYEYRICGFKTLPSNEAAGSEVNPICFDKNGSANQYNWGRFTTTQITRSTVPGTGAILGEDLVTDRNPSNVWGSQDSPESGGSDTNVPGCDGDVNKGASDKYFKYNTTDGDPHYPINEADPNNRWRRYVSEAGEQSLWDYCVGGDSTRTQTQQWSTSGNQMSFSPGKRVFYFSFRLQAPSPFPYTMAAGHLSGIANHSQLFQFKSFGGGNGATFSPVLSGLIASDGIGIRYHDPVNDAKKFTKEIPLNGEIGQWIRVAIVADWDRDGWYSVWIDDDGDGDMEQVIERQKDRAPDDPSDDTRLNFLGNGNESSSWGLGLYHNMELFDGSVSNQPRRETVWTDYANAQITNYTGE